MGLNLRGKIELDGSGFERGLHRAGEKAIEFSADLIKNAAVAAFGLYGVEQAIEKTVETATDLVNTSKRLDVTVEQLQLLRQAAKDGGTEMGTLASAFEKLDIARSKALGGNKGALEAFGKLGVSVGDLRSQTAAKMFTGAISSSVKNNNVESLAPALKEILGKGFGELIPVLKTDFDELGEKMHKLGTIMDADTAVKLKAIGENFDLLKNILAVQLGPVIISVVETFLEVIGKVKAFGAYLGGLSEKGIIKGAATVLNDLKDNPVASSLINAIPGAGAAAQYFGSKFDSKELEGISADAGQAYNDTSDDWSKTMDELRQKLADSAKDLENPKPIIQVPDPEKTVTKKLSGVPNVDSLLKVGNFLGATGKTISKVDKQKIDLLQKIVDNTKPKTSGFNFFGIDIPLA